MDLPEVTLWCAVRVVIVLIREISYAGLYSIIADAPHGVLAIPVGRGLGRGRTRSDVHRRAVRERWPDEDDDTVFDLPPVRAHTRILAFPALVGGPRPLLEHRVDPPVHPEVDVVEHLG